MHDHNDNPELYDLQDVTIPAGEEWYVPPGETIGVLDLTVQDTATLVSDGDIEVFGDILGNGTITGGGTITDRQSP